jgi:hypothetical protein
VIAVPVARTTAGIAIQPALLLGIGRFGAHGLAAALAALRGVHPDLAAVTAGVGLTDTGFTSPAEPLPGELHDTAPADAHALESWLESRRSDGLRLLQERMYAIRAQGAMSALAHAGYRRWPGMDIYLIADTGDAFSRRALPTCLDLVRQASADLTREGGDVREQVSITLCLGVDSVGLPVWPRSEQCELKEFVAWLLDTLYPATEDASLGPWREPPVAARQRGAGADGFGSRAGDDLGGGAGRNGRHYRSGTRGPVDWCYLVDTTDEDGRTLAPLAAGRDSGTSPDLLRAEVIAGFLAFLIGSSLRNSEEYTHTRTALIDYPRTRGATGIDAHQVTGTAGALAALSCASWVAPVASHRLVAAHASAVRILRDGVLGTARDERRAGLGRAAQLADECIARFGLSANDLLAWLQRDEQGKLVDLSIDRRRLAHSHDDDLVERFVAWEARFNRDRMDRPLEDVRERAMERADAAAAAARDTVGHLLGYRVRGIRTARPFLELLREGIRSQEEVTRVPERRGWLHLLLGPLVPRRARPARPDPRPDRRRLEAALLDRVTHAAIWIRYLLTGVALYWLLVGIWPYLEAAAGRSLRPPFTPPGATVGAPADLATQLVLAAAVFVLMAVAALIHLVGAEQSIVRARDRLARTAERRVQAVFDLACRRERDAVYRRLLQSLDVLTQEVNAWEHVIEALASRLEEAAGTPPPTWLCLEAPAAEAGGDRSPTADRTTNVEQLAEAVLIALRGAPWHTWSAAEVERAVLQVSDRALDGVDRTSDRVPAAERTAPAFGPPRAAELLDQLRAHIRPLANFRRDWPGRPVVHFVGAADPAVLAGAETLAQPRAVLVATLDPGRVTYAPAYFGVHFDDLAIAEMLERVPCAGAADATP